MKNLVLKKYEQLIQRAEVLTDDEYGDKVLLLSDNTIIKLFRVKRLISSANFYSYARRFARNVTRLQALSIPTVSLIELYKIKTIKRTAVHYQQLEGVTVRDYIRQKEASEPFFRQLGCFLADLHSLGIYFRSIHFGNIVYTPEHTFGLIDVSDMKIYRSPLNKNKRLRNLKHFFKEQDDMAFIGDNHIIEKSYLQHCSIKTPSFREKFLSISQKLRAANKC